MDELKKFYDKNSSSLLKRSLLFILLVLIMAVVMYLINSFLAFDIDQLSPDIKDFANENMSTPLFNLILNNVIRGLLVILIGFIPFLYLPWWIYFLNTLFLGVIIGINSPNILYIFVIFIFAYLPYGLFEIPALVLSVSLGGDLCQHITGMILDRSSPISLGQRLKNTFLVFFTAIMPLFILGGLIESQLSWRIFSFVQGLLG